MTAATTLSLIAPVREPWRTVAQVCPTATTHLAACRQRFADLPTAMLQIEQIEHGDAAGFCFAHHRHPGGFATRIDFDAYRLKLAIRRSSVHQPYHER
jgi:hypothetical protein